MNYLGFTCLFCSVLVPFFFGNCSCSINRRDKSHYNVRPLARARTNKSPTRIPLFQYDETVTVDRVERQSDVSIGWIEEYIKRKKQINLTDPKANVTKSKKQVVLTGPRINQIGDRKQANVTQPPSNEPGYRTQGEGSNEPKSISTKRRKWKNLNEPNPNIIECRKRKSSNEPKMGNIGHRKRGEPNKRKTNRTDPKRQENLSNSKTNGTDPKIRKKPISPRHMTERRKQESLAQLKSNETGHKKQENSNRLKTNGTMTGKSKPIKLDSKVKKPNEKLGDKPPLSTSHGSKLSGATSMNRSSLINKLLPRDDEQKGKLPGKSEQFYGLKKLRDASPQ